MKYIKDVINYLNGIEYEKIGHNEDLYVNFCNIDKERINNDYERVIFDETCFIYLKNQVIKLSCNKAITCMYHFLNRHKLILKMS